MTVTITIQCDNAAFEDDWKEEVARMLTTWIEHGQPDGNLRDINGNVCGTVVYP